jgi:hypothetical protein
MVYGRRQPRTKNASFEFRRREGSSSAHEITEDVPEPSRRSKRAAGRINLPRGAMRIEDSEPESTSSDDDEESSYKQEPSPPESPTAAAQRKRKGKNIRTTSNEHSQGTGDDDSDGECEGISVLGPQPVESGAVTHFNVGMRPPVDLEHRNIVNYKRRGMTERERKEREQNPLTVGGRNLDYWFGTKFHQDYYASAIIKKDFPIARSEYIDWGFLSVMEDPKIAEIIRECKRKNVYDIMGFAKSWNNEVIAQFYATCYFTTWKNDKVVHWMTEGKWFGLSLSLHIYLVLMKKTLER